MTNKYFILESYQRLADDNVVVAVAPLWVPMNPTYKPIEQSYIGIERQNACYPIQTLMDKGIVCTFHTDNPVSPVPQTGIIPASLYLSLTRHFYDDTALTSRRSNYEEEHIKERYEAIKAMTYNVAYEFGIENEYGSIEQGKVANFTIFDQNFLTCSMDDLHNAKLVSTIVDGEEVWSNDKNKYKTTEEIIKYWNPTFNI